MTRRAFVHPALFLATLLTTWMVGIEHYAAFLSGFSGQIPEFSWWNGLWYAGGVLGILGAHEFGGIL